MVKYLIVYKCHDNGEEESCFLLDTEIEAINYIISDPEYPEGFEHRAGRYFYEPHEIPY